MVEAVSATSSLISLAKFALQASKSLYQTLEKSKSREKIVRELRDELESLSETLRALSGVVIDKEVQLTALNLPLLRCGITCREIEKLISKFVSLEESQEPGFHWAKLRYMGGGITDFIATLASYRATISIALASTTLQQCTVTKNVLEEYKQTILDTKSDLEYRLEQISETLQSLDLEDQSSKETDLMALTEAEDEKRSIQQCLGICVQVSKAVEISRSQLLQQNSDEDLAPNLRLSTKSTALEERLAELVALTKPFEEQQQLDSETAEVSSVNEEHDSVVKCVDARVDASELAGKSNVFEDCTIAGSHQVVSAREISTQDNRESATVLGQMPDESLEWEFSHLKGSTVPKEEELEAHRRVPGQHYLYSPSSMHDTVSMTQSQEVLAQREESSFGVTTLPGSHEQPAPELKPSSWLDEAPLDDLEGKDCVSIVSDDNDIASQVSMIRTQPVIFAVRHIASFLYELEELRPLHEKALKTLGPNRFQHNYRRILKSYVLKLSNEAQTAVQNDIIRVLKSRLNRMNVAQRIVALIQEEKHDTTKLLDSVTSQPVEKQSLEEWARYAHGPPIADPVFYPDWGDCEQSSEDSDSEETKTEHRVEELLFPNITHANKFLHQAIPFRTLLLGLRLLVLPALLREVAESIPKHLIHISSGNNRSLIDLAKAWIEDHSAFEWDWWPLMPREPQLPPGRLLLQWKFCGQTLYKEVSLEDSVSILQALVLTGDHPPKCFCCEEKKLATQANRMTWTRLLQSTRKSLLDLLSWKAASNSLIGQTSQSIAHQRYTPASTASTSASSTAHNSTTMSLPDHSGSSGAISSGSTDTLSSSGHRDPLWVVFGIKDVHQYDKIENIEASNLLNDSSFFREVKKRYAKHRWLFRRWFSPFRFRYCKFVQFESINFDQVYCVGEALPDELGYTRDYEYRPRPPKAKNPLINK